MCRRRAQSEAKSDLSQLISEMSPVLDHRPWVFVSVTTERAACLRDKALATFLESEGVTLVLRHEDAREISNCSTKFARITLQIHSSLEAVGLTAAVAQALAEMSISANIIAAYYHDHIFVPFDQADGALMCLTSLSESKQAECTDRP